MIYFNLIIFENSNYGIWIIIYILTPKFLINFNRVFKYKDGNEKIKLNF